MKNIVLNVMKKMAVVGVLCAGFAVFIKMPGGMVHAMEGQKVDVPVVSSVIEGDEQIAVYSQAVRLSDSTGDFEKSDEGHFAFELREDSWVHFTGNYSNNNHDGVGTDVSIYSDLGFSRKVMEYGFGYWRYKNECYGFLKKGTYYGDVRVYHENYDDFVGNVNIEGYAIPVSKVLKINKKVKRGVTTVTIEDVLGNYGRGMQCINKSVGSNSLYNRKVWKEYAPSVRVWVNGSKKAKVLKLSGNGKYSYKVKKRGKYTFMIEDVKGSRYQKTMRA